MSTFAAGQPVTVHIGGVEKDPTGHEGEYIETHAGKIRVGLDGTIIGFPESWVAPVTPPCPWTELGTIVRIKGGDIFELADRGWFIVGDGSIADYARTIAPFNPVRLIPEGTERTRIVEDLRVNAERHLDGILAGWSQNASSFAELIESGEIGGAS